MKRPLCVDCIHENVYPNVEPCFSCEPFGRTNFIAKPQAKLSNYARIRNKTPEELAKELVRLSDRCPDGYDCDSVPPGRKCFTCWLDWLNEEAEE